jgi:hypothetical protein
MMTSSTAEGSILARDTASRTTIAPRSVADNGVSDPWNFPIGVRTADKITGSRTFVLSILLSLGCRQGCQSWFRAWNSDSHAANQPAAGSRQAITALALQHNVQALAHVDRKREQPAVAAERDRLARGVNHHFAVMAPAGVRFDGALQVEVQVPIQVIRDLTKDVLTVQSYLTV